MSAALIMVWLGTAASLDAHQADIEGWAISRQVRVEEPADEPVLSPAGHDDDTAERVEALLAEARTDAYSTDTTAAEAALDSAEVLIQRTPALPESAWLMAEIFRARAALVAGSDPAHAADLEARATALAGPRAAVFTGGVAAPKNQAAVSAPAEVRPTLAAAPSSLEGPLPTDDVEIDGVGVGAARTIHEGAHHVRVLRGGRLAWAGWVTANGGQVVVQVPHPIPCGRTDLSSEPGGEPKPVECDRYTKARPAGPERIEVALCHHSSCGQWLPWSRAWGATFEGPVHSPLKERPSRAFIVWTAAGVGAAIIGAIILVEAGAFEQKGPTRETLIFIPPPPK